MKNTFITILTFVSLILPGLVEKSVAQSRAIVNFQTDAEGHIFVKAAINGVSGTFIFDTGAGATLVTKKFADKVSGLKKMQQNFTGFRATGEPLSADLLSGGELEMGGFKQSKDALIEIDADLGPADGLISLLSLRNTPFTINYEQRNIVFEDNNSLKTRLKKGRSIPVQLDAIRDKAIDIFAYFVVNQQLRLQFMIDSGAGNDVVRINARYAPMLAIDTASARKISHKSEFNPEIITTNYLAPIHTIKLCGDTALKRTVKKALFIKGLIYDGVVSLNMLGPKITFNLPKSTIIID